MHVVGQAYIGTREDDEYWAEGEACEAEVERTDANEVRLGIRLEPGSSDDATLYLTVAEAGRLAHLLGAAILANEFAAHEAAKL